MLFPISQAKQADSAAIKPSIHVVSVEGRYFVHII